MVSLREHMGDIKAKHMSHKWSLLFINMVKKDAEGRVRMQ